MTASSTPNLPRPQTGLRSRFLDSQPIWSAASRRRSHPIRYAKIGVSEAASLSAVCASCSRSISRLSTRGESAGGIAPPAARRTVRKPLGLHGSHRPAIRFEAEAPVSEQARRASSDADQEKPCPFLASAEPFELAHGPAHQVVIEAPQEGIQHGLLFTAMFTGFILRPVERTVCGMLTGAGLAGVWHHSRAHRFFSGTRWDVRQVGLILAALVVDLLLPPDAAILLAIDETLTRRRGPKVFAASWWHDGSAAGATKIGYGNSWVVLAIVVTLPFC